MTRHPSVIPAVLLLAAAFVSAGPLPQVTKVERQPLAAQAQRVADALELLGAPLPETERKTLAAAAREADAAKAVETIQTVLDRHCLAGVRITATDKLETYAGPAKPELAEQGWRVFLVKVANPAEVQKLELRPESPNALPLTVRSSSKPDPKVVSVDAAGKRFLDLMTFNQQPLVRDLSGLELEYRIVQIYSRDPGRKEAAIGFGLYSGPKDKEASSNLVTFLFESAPAVLVRLKVRDHDGKPVMGAFTFRDSQGRYYPSMSRRLAPDFAFHPQIYRNDGESVLLQPGKYVVTATRGPEYLLQSKEIVVTATAPTQTESFELKRWIHPAATGWYSGDHHIHAAGCAHYESPTEGVTPEDMMRHVLGEDLNVGCCLSWGPCWYHQKRYFDGKPHALSTPANLLRYDVEVSGFPSSHCGHVCLLRLREQDYPGTKLIGDWPSWDLPIFQWAKGQGGVVGFAHSGWGLQPETPDDPSAKVIPNYLLPRMDGIGANEYLVDVAHDACDFISTVDTPSTWELNIWYHTLNCGYRCRISGETDFPCIYDERVGLGRSYVHLDGKLDFDRWMEGVKKGRCYVSDGKSHLLDFSVGGTSVGVGASELRLKQPRKVSVTARVAARLEPRPTPETERIRKSSLTTKPYWELERARIGESRKVPVEVVVNGQRVASKEIIADGSAQELSFDVPLERSSWVCLRVLPSSHTNPVFVVIDDKPIRASKRSVEWCLQGLEQCWKKKKPQIRQAELGAAEAAYDLARKQYKKILAETEAP